MKKEIVIVIVLGLVIGLAITLLAYRARIDKSLNVNTNVGRKIELDTTLLNAEVKKEDEGKPVQIVTPEAGFVSIEKKITVKGVVPPNTTAILFVNDIDQIQQAPATGEVTFEVELESGSNIIELSSIDSEGAVHNHQIVVINSTQSLEEVLVPESEVKEEAKEETSNN